MLDLMVHITTYMLRGFGEISDRIDAENLAINLMVFLIGCVNN